MAIHALVLSLFKINYCTFQQGSYLAIAMKFSLNLQYIMPTVQEMVRHQRIKDTHVFFK